MLLFIEDKEGTIYVQGDAEKTTQARKDDQQVETPISARYAIVLLL